MEADLMVGEVFFCCKSLLSKESLRFLCCITVDCM